MDCSNRQDLNKELLIKRLKYRSLNRGCKELDLIIGDFASFHLGGMSLQELLEYQQILDLNDYYFYNYLLNAINRMPDDAGIVMKKIIDFVKTKAA